MRAAVLGALALLAVTAAAPPATADDAPAVATAFALCRDADFLPADDKDAQRVFLESGVTLAEEAVAARPKDPRAQLALSCLLGKHLLVSGISWRVFQRLNRLRTVIDTALRLAPGDPDAMVAKAELLHQLPGALGGDLVESERLFRLALEKTPEHVQARIHLGEILAERGHADASHAASRALVLAERDGTPREKSAAAALYRRCAQ
jgi:hypothetical protein